MTVEKVIEILKLKDDRTPWLNVHSAYDEMPLSLEAFRVLCHLSRRSNGDKGSAWPSYNSIGECCFRASYPKSKPETLRRKAINAVNELIGFGLIRKQTRYKNEGTVFAEAETNEYILTHSTEWNIHYEGSKNTRSCQGTRQKRGGSDGGTLGSDGGTLGSDDPSPKGIPSEGIPSEINPFQSIHPRPQNFELEANASTLGTSHEENENEKVSTNEMDNTCIIGENLEEQKFNSGGAAVVQMSSVQAIAPTAEVLPVVQASSKQQYEAEWKKLPKRGKSIDSRSAPFKSWAEQWGEAWSKDWKDDWENMTPDAWVKTHFDKWFKIEIWVPYPNYKNRKKNQESAIARLKKAILDKSSDPRMIVRRLEYDMNSSWEGDRIQYVQQPDVWANARAWLEDNGWDEPPDPFACMDQAKRRKLEQLPEPKAYCERLNRANYLVTYECPPETHPMLGTVFSQQNSRYYIYERFVKDVAPPSLLEFLEKISNKTQV